MRCLNCLIWFLIYWGLNLSSCCLFSISLMCSLLLLFLFSCHFNIILFSLFCCIYYLQLIILVVALGLCYRFLACLSLPSSDSVLLRVYYESLTVVSVQFIQSLSCVQLFATPWIAARQASLSITNSRSSLRLTSIESVMPSSHLILCRPLLLLPPIPPSISLFQWVNSSHEVAKVLEFQL